MPLLGSVGSCPGCCPRGSIGERRRWIIICFKFYLSLGSCLAWFFPGSRRGLTSRAVEPVAGYCIPITTVKYAIPIIMGANIGTSVTNTIVSMAHAGERLELERAFSGATVHDMFNMLSVAVMLPEEVILGAITGEGGILFYISKGITEGVLGDVTDVTFTSPTKFIVSPLTDVFVDPNKDVTKALSLGAPAAQAMPTGLTGSCPSTMDCSNYFCVSSAMTKNWKKVNEDAYEALSECSTYFPLLNHGCGSDTCYLEADKFYTESIEGGTILDGGAFSGMGDVAGGIVGLIFSLIIITFFLFCLVKLLHTLVMGSAKKVIMRATNMNDYVATLVGLGITFIVQSSSVTTSTLTPLCGVGVLPVHKMLPMTLGANIGTTFTSMLAALAVMKPDSLQIAFVHLFFKQGKLSEAQADKWWTRRPQGFSWKGSWQELAVDVEEPLASEQRSQRRYNLNRWKHSMRQRGKAATRWVSQTTGILPPSVSKADGTLTSTYEDAIRVITEFWRAYWTRPEVPNIAEVARDWVQALGRDTHPLQWEDVTAAELQAAARQLCGSGGGPDGFSGDEVADLPVEVWQAMAAQVQRWLLQGRVPQILKHLRQVQVPKDGVVDGSVTDPANLRPISVMSCFWRVLTSALAARTGTRAWLRDLVPTHTYGAVEGQQALTAVITLEQFWRAHSGILASLDYEKCFDTASPALCLRVMVEAGFPSNWARLILQVWGNQHRWVEYGGAIAPRPEHVARSLVQGDALSCLALVVLLAGPFASVQRSCGQDLCMTSFVDDRAGTAAAPEVILSMIRGWRDWSVKLGLMENAVKLRLVCHTEEQERRLRLAGIPEDCIQPRCRILGVDFTKDWQDKVRPTAQSREQAALQKAARIRSLPLETTLRRDLWRTRIVPKVAWGHGLRLPRTKESRAVHWAYRLCTRRQNMASPHLAEMLEGHDSDPIFCTGFKATKALFSSLQQAPIPWGPLRVGGAWQVEVRKWLKGLGWRETRPWTWRHANLGEMSWDPRRVFGWDHVLRESWRRHKFSLFLQQKRRDATALRGRAMYDERSCRITRELYRKGDAHARGR